jgi:hypothetical protein
VRFEPAGVRYGIPAVGLPATMPYGGRIVGANGLSISTPCPRKLASDRRILLARPSAPGAAPQVLPVVGLDFRGPWQVGYASLARVSPAGIATLPDGSHVKVAGIGPTGSWAPFSLPQRRVPWPDPLRGGYPARPGAQIRRTAGASLDYEPGNLGDVTNPVATAATLNALGAVPKVLVPTANDFGQVLGPGGSNLPIGPAQIDTGLSNAEDFLAQAGHTAAAAAGVLPSWGQFTTLLVCVLVAVGVWFLWPILSAARRLA